MCTVIVFITYAFFLRTIDVDVMEDVTFNYTGENGSASVTISNGALELNQRTREFMDTVVYEITPNKNLSNGDTIHVVATYDEALAEQYHFKAINTEKDVEVSGLKNRYNALEEMDEKYLKEIYKAQDTYLNSRKEDVYNMIEDSELEYKMEKSDVVYRAFLKSKSTQSDRIIAIYKLTFRHEEETLDVYYLVTVPDINDGKRVNTDNIFGTKAYLTEAEKTEEKYYDYVVRIYSGQFDIWDIPLENQVVEEKKEETTDEIQVEEGTIEQ